MTDMGVLADKQLYLGLTFLEIDIGSCLLIMLGNEIDACVVTVKHTDVH